MADYYSQILGKIAGEEPRQGPFDAFLEGREARRKFQAYERDDKARDLTGQYLTGNKQAAQELARIDPGAYMKAKSYTREEAAAEFEERARVLAGINNPDDWAKAVASMEAKGVKIDPEERDFANKHMVISRGLKLIDQMRQSNEDRKFAADQDYRNQSLGIQRMNAETSRLSAQNRSTMGDPQERAALAQTFGLQPGTPEYQSYVLTGKMPLPQKGKEGLSATQLRFKRESEDSLRNIENTRANLSRAQQLLGPDDESTKLDQGLGAGWRAYLTNRTGIPLASKDAAMATEEWGKIMSSEAIRLMADTLKGATTDFEMRKFEQLMADPETPNSIKRRELGRMVQRAEAARALEQERLASPDLGGQQQPAPQAQSRSLEDWAQEAIQNGADPNAVMQRLQQMQGQ